MSASVSVYEPPTAPGIASHPAPLLRSHVYSKLIGP
jgi:hypothetical protein